MKKTVSEAIKEIASEASERLTAEELQQLYEVSDDPFELITACFNYGFYKGKAKA